MAAEKGDFMLRGLVLHKQGVFLSSGFLDRFGQIPHHFLSNHGVAEDIEKSKRVERKKQGRKKSVDDAL